MTFSISPQIKSNEIRPWHPPCKGPLHVPLSAYGWQTKLNHCKDNGSIQYSTISIEIASNTCRAFSSAADAAAAPGIFGPALPAPQQTQPRTPPLSQHPLVDKETLLTAGPTPGSQDKLSLLDGLSAVLAHSRMRCGEGQQPNPPPPLCRSTQIRGHVHGHLGTCSQRAWHS